MTDELREGELQFKEIEYDLSANFSQAKLRDGMQRCHLTFYLQ